MLGRVEEMELTLFKSSHSTIVKAGLDASAALFTTDGQTIAQATGSPIHLGALILAVEAVIRKFPPNRMQPGEWAVNLQLTAQRRAELAAASRPMPQIYDRGSETF